jgi:hypothetical protein
MSGRALHLVGVGAHPYAVGKTNMSIEVGNSRRVLLIRIEGAKHGMPRREPVVEMAKSGEAARNRTWVGTDAGMGGRQEARAEEQARGPGHSTQELAPGHGHRDRNDLRYMLTLLHVMGSEVCLVPLEDAIAALPVPCIAERYISPGRNT